jgi:cytochrome c biogenesis protein CcmG, thiol:disulfide interchange protein DsbE
MTFRVAKLLPFGLFAAMGALLIFSLSNDPKLLPSTLHNAALPAFELPPLEAGAPPLKSAELRGKGLTLINVFGSWCGACRFEHPLLMRISKDTRFKLVGIDWRDAPENGKEYLATYGNPYAQIGVDQAGRTAIDLGVYGAPETFVVDAKGVVRLRVPGPLTPEIWDKDIEPLIKEAEKAS